MQKLRNAIWGLKRIKRLSKKTVWVSDPHQMLLVCLAFVLTMNTQFTHTMEAWCTLHRHQAADKPTNCTQSPHTMRITHSITTVHPADPHNPCIHSVPKNHMDNTNTQRHTVDLLYTHTTQHMLHLQPRETLTDNLSRFSLSVPIRCDDWWTEGLNPKLHSKHRNGCMFKQVVAN